MKRKDEWSYEEDLLLAQTVLEHIENGNTQLNAFETVAVRLKRTPAACGFRWNSTLRKAYKMQIRSAKLKRNSGKKSTRKDGLTTSVEVQHTAAQIHETPFDPIIETLTSLKMEYVNMKGTIDHLTRQVSDLTIQVENKESAISPISKTPSEDMENLLQIIRRAEQLGLFEKFAPKEKPAG
ncbi:prespore-specific regulator [Paenibacillus sp. LBL]|uniref:hypothetical protein n=1 Tax=Paenibacillus sp. LBL TaxID=2940563 RepID=UPI0024746E63|nr:hypothetical protein [Paenibacillus sp. LBL]MDH6675003.1 prespore-specific regulator [Paenibacillus sp. LBL]